MSFESLHHLPTPLRPWCGVALVLGAARVLLAMVGAYCRRCEPSAEVGRKLLHVGVGTVFLAYPWLFERGWPVMVLSGVFVGLLIARRYCEPLQYQVAGVIYRVQRQSWGEYYFPISVAVLFMLARGDALLYCAPLGLLVYADAAAAIVGERYGSRRFAGMGGKSAEGCAAFAVTAFLVAFVAVVLSGRCSPFCALLVAVNVAVFGAVLEALCSQGLDNLAVPLLTWVLLGALLPLGAGMLFLSLVSLVIFLVGAGVVARLAKGREFSGGRVLRRG